MAAVLVIDDDPPQRAVAVFTLKKAGYDVHEAPDGAAGLRSVRELQPDVVVCDVMMPRMNGYQLVAALRREPATATVPVILLTAMAERGQVRLGMTSGADDYLCKPYHPNELLEAIDAVLQRRHAQQAAAAITALRDEEGLPAADDAPLHFRDAVLLVTDLFGWLKARFPAANGSVDLVRRALQAARDTLYLFGADQVVPYGDELLAVFGSQRDAFNVPSGTRAVKAALRLNPAIERVLHLPPSATALRLTVALHRGDFALLKLQDLLHPDAGLAPVPGPALQFAGGLRQFATTRGWEVAASAPLLATLPYSVAVAAQRDSLGDQPVVQLKPA